MGDPLKSIFWRDEILQIMYWMQGERLSDSISPPDLVVFLDAEEGFIQEQLERLVEEGYAQRAKTAKDGYQLTEFGSREGARRFADEFAEMTNKGHGQCNDLACVCQTEGLEACKAHAH